MRIFPDPIKRSAVVWLQQGISPPETGAHACFGIRNWLHSSGRDSHSSVRRIGAGAAAQPARDPGCKLRCNASATDPDCAVRAHGGMAFRG